MADKKDKADEQPAQKIETVEVTKTVETNPDAGKDIDQRMADLLADHEKMGAR